MSGATSGLPIDWTAGGGVIPAGGVSIPANNLRKWLFIQNQGAAAVTVTLTGIVGGTLAAGSVVITLASGSAPIQFNASTFIPLGAVTVTGTTNNAVAVAEG